MIRYWWVVLLAWPFVALGVGSYLGRLLNVLHREDDECTCPDCCEVTDEYVQQGIAELQSFVNERKVR